MTFATSAGRTLTKRDDLDSLRGDLTCRTCHQKTSNATDEWREFKCVVTGEDMDYDWGPCDSYMCGDGAIPFAAAKEPEQTMIHVAFDDWFDGVVNDPTADGGICAEFVLKGAAPPKEEK